MKIGSDLFDILDLNYDQKLRLSQAIEAYESGAHVVINTHDNMTLCSITYYDRNKGLHREDDNPAYEEWYENKVQQEVIYALDGIYQSDISAAVIRYYENGQIAACEYRNKMGLHREDGPAFVSWHKNGNKAQDTHCINGKEHRAGGPAVCIWDENGFLEQEIYKRHGKTHREDGPARRFWRSGSKDPYIEEYYKYGRLHRDPRDGPAKTRDDASAYYWEGDLVDENFLPPRSPDGLGRIFI